MKNKNLIIIIITINLFAYLLIGINFFIYYDRMGDGSFLNSTLNTLILLTLSDVLLICLYRLIRMKNDEQNKFITNSIHTLRTPLNIINANIEIVDDNENIYLKNIKYEIEKLELITNNLLKFSIFKERDFLNPIKVNISINFTMECKKVEVLLKNENKTMNCKIDNDIFWYMSPSRTMVLITTLLDNAHKYSLSCVECNLNSDFLEVINDTNLSDGNYLHLFQRFERNDKAVKGFGVGLSIVNLICNDMKAKLEANVKDGKMIIRINKNKMDIK